MVSSFEKRRGHDGALQTGSRGLKQEVLVLAKKPLGVGTSIFQRVLFDSKGWCIGTLYHPCSTLWKIQVDVFFWFVFSDNYILYNIFICKYVPPLGRLLLYLDSFKVIVFNIYYINYIYI